MTQAVVSPRVDDAAHDPLRVPATSEFKRKSARGGAAAILAQVAAMALQLGTTFILARLLSPTDYGLQAMVLTLTAFFSLFRDAGLSLAVVQRENLTHEQISTLFWINVGLGTFLMVVVAAAGPFLVAFYKEPRLLWLTIASASTFFFSSLCVQHRALLDRAMRFTTSAKIDVLTCVIGSVVAISMAALGCGYWSLICQNISIPVASMIALWIAMPWAPGRPRWAPELRPLIRFGGTITLNSVIVYLAYNTEKILLGRSWGAAPLGIYTRAYQLATLPVQQLIAAAYGIAFSVLSRMQGDPVRLRRSYLKSQSVIVSMTIPVVIGSAFFAKEIVLVVLGAKWLQVTTVLRLLAPTVLVFALVNPFSWLLQSTGRAGRSLWIAILIAPVVVLGILFGLHGGPNGVAMGYSAAMLVLLVPIVVWAKHGTGISTGDYVRSVVRPIVAGLMGGAAGWVAQFLLRGTIKPVPLLTLELALFCLVYGGILAFVMKQKDFYLDLARQMLRQREESEVVA